MAEKQTTQDFETIDVSPCNVPDNVMRNVTHGTEGVTEGDESFPCSQRQAANLLETSPMTVGRWLKALEKAGVNCKHAGKITQQGYEELRALKESGLSPKDYCQKLKAQPLPTPSQESGGELATLSDSHGDIVTQATDLAFSNQASLKAEFFELLDEYEEDKKFSEDLNQLRSAKIQEQAYKEWLQEEKLKMKIKRELTRQKLQHELGGSDNG